MVSRNNLITGLIAGAAVGAVAGVLLAPKSGEVTRRFMGMRANRMRRKAGDYIDALRRRREAQSL